MNASEALLQSHRIINVLSVILGTFAALYGFESILGHRGGLLRQFIVMIPAGMTYAAAGYLLNALSGNFYANVYRELFSTPTISSGIAILVIQFALYGCLLPLTMPNIYRKPGEYDDEFAVPLVVTHVLLQAISKPITFAVLLQIANIGHKLPFGLHLSTAGLLIVSLAFVVVNIPVSIRAAFALYLPRATRWPRKWWDKIPDFAQAWGCLIWPVVIVQYYLMFLAFLTIGWAVLVFVAVILALQVSLRKLQRIADSLSRQKLMHIGLALVLLTAALQLYQAAFL